jgi:hypothetical protein
MGGVYASLTPANSADPLAILLRQHQRGTPQPGPAPIWGDPATAQPSRQAFCPSSARGAGVHGRFPVEGASADGLAVWLAWKGPGSRHATVHRRRGVHDG